MLPSRAYATDPAAYSSTGLHGREPAHAPVLLVATGPQAIDEFSVSSFSRTVAHTTADAIHALERARPRVTAVDWDCPEVDGVALCRRASQVNGGSVLVVTAAAANAPAALRAGCHAILLRPYAPNLLAARVGRLAREHAARPARGGAARQLGTNRYWPATHCPGCGAGDAVSFEFSSYRRMWYACLGCDHVWLGPRQE